MWVKISIKYLKSSPSDGKSTNLKNLKTYPSLILDSTVEGETCLLKMFFCSPHVHYTHTHTHTHTIFVMEKFTERATYLNMLLSTQVRNSYSHSPVEYILPLKTKQAQKAKELTKINQTKPQPTQIKFRRTDVIGSSFFFMWNFNTRRED